MLTFTEYLSILEEETLEEASFTSGGKKYTVSFGKYYCNGVEISKEAYARASAMAYSGEDKVRTQKIKNDIQKRKEQKERLSQMSPEEKEKIRKNKEREEHKMKLRRKFGRI